MVAADRQRVDQPTSSSPRLVFALAGALTVMITGAAAFLLAAQPAPVAVTIAPAPLRVTPPPPVVTLQREPEPDPLPEPVVTTPAPIVTPPPKPVALPKAVTNEEWLQRVFKSKHQKLQTCVEQDLRLRPGAPTLYMVTMTFEPDGLPVNSFTQLTPKGSRAVWDCLRMAIFHAINEEGEHNRALPQPGNFTISLTLDFTGAKPAKQQAVGFGEE
jgi:hypothetical protein